jgi:hypothetical protein
MRVGNQVRFCTAFLLGVAALILGYEVAKAASRNLEAKVGASAQTEGPGPIPPAGPLAEPKSLNKYVSPSRPRAPQRQRRIHKLPRRLVLGEKLFLMIACRWMAPLLAALAMTRRALSPTASLSPSASKAAPASATRPLF